MVGLLCERFVMDRIVIVSCRDMTRGCQLPISRGCELILMVCTLF